MPISQAGKLPAENRRHSADEGFPRPGLWTRWRAFRRLPKDLMLGRALYAAKRPFFALTLPRPILLASAPAALKLSPPDPWPGNAAQGSAIAQGSFTFAGRSIQDPAPLWAPLGASRDWVAALQEFAWLRDLRAAGGDGSRRVARDLVAAWIDANTAWTPAAWGPVVTGQRLANWLGQYEFFAASADLAFRQLLLASATRQARHLSRVLPAGLAGADLIFAVKGLIYAGACLPGGQPWLVRGLALLAQELPRQILADGGHVERSPARQFALLRDLIDLRAVLHAGGIEAPVDLQQAVETLAPALRLLLQGDGGLALFNDSNAGEDWQIDMVLQRAGGPKRPPFRAPDSGFERLQAGRSLVLVDCGRPPPPGLDAHAHAGTLSFEMSSGRERLIVNCGAHAPETTWHEVQRTTAAHSTLTLDDTNSSQLLPGGGLGGRRPQEIVCRREEDDGAIWLEMSHDGYRASHGAVHHRRLYLAAGGDDLRGEDSLEMPGQSGKGTAFKIRFHLHPDARATLAQDGGSVFLRTPKGGGWRLRYAGALASLEPSVYLGRAGEIRRCEQIVLSGETGGAETRVKWVLQREGRK